MQGGLEKWGCRRQPNQLLIDTNSSEAEKDKFLRYLKNNEFVFGEQSLSRRVMREKTGEIRKNQHIRESYISR